MSTSNGINCDSDYGDDDNDKDNNRDCKYKKIIFVNCGLEMNMSDISVAVKRTT